MILNEITCSEANSNYYSRAGFICLMMKGLCLDDWLEQQIHKITQGDEFSIYVLCHSFMHHAMVHTKNKPWYTIQQMGGNFNYASACQTHLLYMGTQADQQLPASQSTPSPPSSTASMTHATHTVS